MFWFFPLCKRYIKKAKLRRRYYETRAPQIKRGYCCFLCVLDTRMHDIPSVDGMPTRRCGFAIELGLRACCENYRCVIISLVVSPVSSSTFHFFVFFQNLVRFFVTDGAIGTRIVHINHITSRVVPCGRFCVVTENRGAGVPWRRRGKWRLAVRVSCFLFLVGRPPTFGRGAVVSCGVRSGERRGRRALSTTVHDDVCKQRVFHDVTPGAKFVWLTQHVTAG